MNTPKYPYINKTELNIFRCIYSLWLLNKRKTDKITWRDIAINTGGSKWTINKTMRILVEKKLIKRDFCKFGPKFKQPANPMYGEGSYISVSDLGADFWKYTNHHTLIKSSKR